MPAGLCRSRVRGAVHTEARWKDAEDRGEQAGHATRLLQGCHSASRDRTQTAHGACCVGLKTISTLGNARTCLSPSRTKSCPSSVPGHHREETWGHTVLKGTGMH